MNCINYSAELPEVMYGDGEFICIESNNVDETIKIANIFGEMLIANDIICLDGDLGAGKTAFTSGVANSIGIKDIIPSPTFTILIEHRKGEIPLFHFDAYRLNSEDEFYDLGFDEYLNCGGICVIEWASRIMNIFPSTVIQVFLLRNNFNEDNNRKIIFYFPKNDMRSKKFRERINKSDDYLSKWHFNKEYISSSK